MAAECIFTLSRIQTGARGHWRIQRQVHVQPIRAARGLVRHLPNSYSPHLPQLLRPGQAMAVHGHSPRKGCLMKAGALHDVLLTDIEPTSEAFETEFIAGL